jgi:nicotinamide riboside kinase
MTEETLIKKIVIIGPESTGKSALCEQLAQHFDTLWCPEYAREYLLAHGKNYTYDDLLTIAKGQLQLEDEYVEKVLSEMQETRNKKQKTKNKKQEPEIENLKLKGINHKRETINNKHLFIDTDMYVMKVWSEYVFGKCHQFILDQIVERKYNLYLLCNIDLPWVQDELREYPKEEPRKELYRIYKDILINQQTPWVEIRGDYKERLQQAIAAVEQYVSKNR